MLYFDTHLWTIFVKESSIIFDLEPQSSFYYTKMYSLESVSLLSCNSSNLVETSTPELVDMVILGGIYLIGKC